jgi:hypothetical protein
MEDWVIEQTVDGHFHLKASEAGRAVDLFLVPDREPLIHGKKGVSPKSSKPGHASHYYSLTRMNASGSITIDGKTHAVRGLVWFDHEWATNSLDSDEAGWDWSGLHLSNGDDLMLFRIRNKDGNSVFLSVTIRDAKGVTSGVKDLVMAPRGGWKSPQTKALYPGGFDIFDSFSGHLSCAAAQAFRSGASSRSLCLLGGCCQRGGGIRVVQNHGGGILGAHWVWWKDHRSEWSVERLLFLGKTSQTRMPIECCNFIGTNR